MNSFASILAPVVVGLLIEHQHLMAWAILAAVLSCVGAVLSRQHHAAVAA